MEIVPGVYAGGVESAADLVLRGELEAGEFRLLAGYSGVGAVISCRRRSCMGRGT